MSAELISILVLVAIFALATLLPINMGALGFAAAFLVGTLAADFDSDKIFEGFPGDLFVVLVGVTYLFAIAQGNGTIDRLVAWAVRLVGGRMAAIPWVMFGVTAVLTGVGAVSPAAVAIIAPVALGFAARYGINPLMVGLMVIHGAQAGGFSPISIYGTIVEGVVGRADIASSEMTVFLASLAFNTAAAAIVFVVLGGLKLGRREPAEIERREQEETDTPTTGPLSFDQILTIVGIVVLVVLTLAFDDLDVGLVAITIAVVLGVFSPSTQKKAVEQITWPVVLLICGIVTYVAVLEEMGTIDYVGDAAKDAGAPLVAALLLCYVGAIVSAFASSVGVLGAIIPLAFPFLLQGEVGAVGMIAALAVASTMVDVSPFSTNGAIVLANAKGVDRDEFYKRLLRYGAAVVVVAPMAAWFVLVVIGG